MQAQLPHPPLVACFVNERRSTVVARLLFFSHSSRLPFSVQIVPCLCHARRSHVRTYTTVLSCLGKCLSFLFKHHATLPVLHNRWREGAVTVAQGSVVGRHCMLSPELLEGEVA